MIDIIQGDCLEVMKTFDDNQFDLVLTDPPYGTTECKWDIDLPLSVMWDRIVRIVKPSGSVVMTAGQPFSSKLVVSNLPMFKYEWVWRKSKAQNFAQAPYRAMCNHESVLVFSQGGSAKNAKCRMVYNPQGISDCEISCKGKGASHSAHRMRTKDQDDYLQTTTGYPKTVVDFANEGSTTHPTQKPLEMIEYFIETYTNKGDTILDPFLGSGTTAVACERSGRNCVGIEISEEYCNIARKRVQEERDKMGLFNG